MARSQQQTQKPAAKAGRNPISQSEIQSVMDMENTIDAVILGFRRRLRSGAAVETGKWQLIEDGSTIEEYGPTDGGARCGLNILPVEFEDERALDENAGDGCERGLDTGRQWLQ